MYVRRSVGTCHDTPFCALTMSGQGSLSWSLKTRGRDACRKQTLVGEAWSVLSSGNRRCCNAVLDASAAAATTSYDECYSLSACHDPAGTQTPHGQRSDSGFAAASPALWYGHTIHSQDTDHGKRAVLVPPAGGRTNQATAATYRTNEPKYPTNFGRKARRGSRCSHFFSSYVPTFFFVVDSTALYARRHIYSLRSRTLVVQARIRTHTYRFASKQHCSLTYRHSS